MTNVSGCAMADLPMLETSEYIVTIDPDFADLGWEEVRAVDSRAEVGSELAPGVLLVHGEKTFADIAFEWLQAQPIFVRHICPVQIVAPLTGSAGDIAVLSQYVAGELAVWIDTDASFSVQSRIFTDLPYKPFDLNKALAETIGSITGATLDIRVPQQVLSVVCAVIGARESEDRSQTQGSKSALLGLSPTFLNLSDWAGGMRRFAARTQSDQSRRIQIAGGPRDLQD